MNSSDFNSLTSWPCSFLPIGILLSKTRLGVLLANPCLTSGKIAIILYTTCGSFRRKRGNFKSHFHFRFSPPRTCSSFCFLKKLLFFSYLSNLPVLVIFFFLSVKHKAKCSICKEYPIVGFRFVVLFFC